MTEPQYKELTTRVDALLGIHMTWEGPEPHDFRSMKERGVRFVHSDLCARLQAFDGDTDELRPYLIDIGPASDSVEFKVSVGDDAAREDIERRIAAAGFSTVYEPTYGVVCGQLRFTVALSWLAEEQMESNRLTKILEAARAVVRRVSVCRYPDDHETAQLLRDLDTEIEKAKQAA